MSQGKPSLLGAILAMAALSSLKEESEKNNDPKSFDELLDKIFGSEPKKPAKDTSGSMESEKSFYQEFKDRFDKDLQEKIIAELYPKIQTMLHSELTKINSLVGLNISKLHIQEVKESKPSTCTAMYVNQIYKGFFIGATIDKLIDKYYVSDIRFYTRGTDGRYIGFKNIESFIHGTNKLIGLKEIIMNDLEKGILK